MQLASKEKVDGTVMFGSHAVAIPLSDREKSRVFASLSSSDGLIIGQGRDEVADVSARRPCASIALDWINTLGLLELSGYDRVLLAADDELEEILASMAHFRKKETAGDAMPDVLYSFSDELPGILPSDFLRRGSDGEWTYKGELDDDMLGSALGACLSSKALYCAAILHVLKTGTGSLPGLSRNELQRAVRILSCGMIDFPAELFSPWIESWESPSFEREITRLGEMSDDERIAAQAGALREISMLRELIEEAWGGSWGLFDGFTVTRSQILSNFCRSDREVSEKLRENGMESFVGTMLAGVPIEDIIC